MQNGNCDEVRELRRPLYLGRALERRPRLSISPRVKAERELSVDWRAPKPLPIAPTHPCCDSMLR